MTSVHWVTVCPQGHGSRHDTMPPYPEKPCPVKRCGQTVELVEVTTTRRTVAPPDSTQTSIFDLEPQEAP